MGPDSSGVEHVLGKNGVGGSIPPLGSIVLPISKERLPKWLRKDLTAAGHT